MLRRLYNDNRGGVAVGFAVSLIVLLGFAGAATEIGSWLLTRRSMQGAADAAAVSAVTGLAAGATDYTTQAKGVTAKNNWTDGSNGITVTVNMPPLYGNYTANNTALEVIIAQAQPQYFSALLPGTSAATIRAHAVALTSPTTGGGCLLGLSGTTSVTGSGNAHFSLNGCDIDGNGNLTLQGNPTISAHAEYIDGTNSIGGSSTLNLVKNPPTTHYGTTFTDPYAGNVTLPARSAWPACVPFSGTFTIAKTVNNTPMQAYCGGISINGGNLTIPSGVYLIEGGTFNINGNATLTSAAGGVTFVFTGTNAAPTVAASFSINGTANLNLTAPPQGAMTAGLIFYQDPATTSGGGLSLLGTGNLNLNGAIDFSKSTVNISGTGDLYSSTSCLEIIGYTVNIGGTGTLSSNCPATTGVRGFGPGAGAIRLVE
jgi:Flp pilus assembly protein TadG